MPNTKRVGLAISGLLCLLALCAQSASPPRPGADIYRTYCAVCHSAGWHDAPIAAIPEEWTSRLNGSADLMFNNVKQGVNAMPPMGTCMDCSDDELKDAIAEMLP